MTVMISLGGCQLQNNLNDEELLNINRVVTLLNSNGLSLKSAMDFPIDLSLCKVYDKEPRPFKSTETGVYYMFYGFDGYNETSDLVKEGPFFEYPDCAEEYSKFVLPSGIAGKNIYISLWYPQFYSWTEGMNKEELKDSDALIKEVTKLREILVEQAFHKKTAILFGQSDNWQVAILIEYVYNQLENENGMSKTVFFSRGQTYVKYLKKTEKMPNLMSMKWGYGDRYSRLSVKEGSLATKELWNDFYSISKSDPSSFNPELEKSLIVKITLENGKTETITCKAFPSNDMNVYSIWKLANPTVQFTM